MIYFLYSVSEEIIGMLMVEGEENVSKMDLTIDNDDRGKLEITCSASNPSGLASHTIAVYIHCKLHHVDIHLP